MNEIKDFVKTLDKPILIYGMGKSGGYAARALAKAGADIVIGDDNQDVYKNFKHENISYLDADLDDLSGFGYLMLSPGIPLTHPEPHDIVKKAQASDLEILCDIELFSRIYPDVKTIGVTGTNGKSTTSALINHLINAAGKKALFGGNIGTAIFDLDIEGQTPDWVILEMSSFQIDLCPTYRPDIAVILNLTPDHIDRHGSMENYADVKERLAQLRSGAKEGGAVICSDDEYTKKILSRVKEQGLRTVVEISTEKSLTSGVFVQDDILSDASDEGVNTVGDLSKVQTLKGVHNHQNAACAYAAVKMAGLTAGQIWDGLESFPGLNHRQFLVRTINGVGYVNDSKSTNAASAAVALGCQKNVYWIVGGRRKKTGLDGLENFFPHLKHAFLIGESTEDFANWFDQYGMEYTRCFKLENAIEDAHKMAQENRGQPGGAGVVLLSPACASFDQYKSFEERGNHFADIVNALADQ